MGGYWEILNLATKLPTGARDEKARVKLEREYDELIAELAKLDRAGALLEAADCLYYAAKCVYNALMTRAEADAFMRRVGEVSGFELRQIRRACIAKYSLRARPGNPKNDAEERAAVADLL